MALVINSPSLTYESEEGERDAHQRRCTDEKKPVEVIGGFVLSIMVRHYLGNAALVYVCEPTNGQA